MKFVPAKPKKTKSSKIVSMKPSEFLELSFPQKPGKDTYDRTLYNQKSLQRLEHRIREEKEVDIPHFDVEVEPERGRIVGHGGRHRAFVSHSLGLEKIPVELRFRMGYKPIEHYGVTIPENIALKPETFRRRYELERAGFFK